MVNCGTGSYSCFYASSYYFYSQWKLQWTTTPSSGYNGYGGTQSGLDELHQGDGGFLAISAQNGPQMNLIFHYDSGANAWGMVGIGDSTPEIETGKLAGGSSASSVSTYGYTSAYNIPFPDLTSPVHSVSLTGMEPTAPQRPTGSALEQTDSTTSTVQPAATHDVPLVTTTHTKPPHTSGVVLLLVQDIMDAWPPLVEPYKVGNVAPTPDTSAPTMDRSGMRDSAQQVPYLYLHNFRCW